MSKAATTPAIMYSLLPVQSGFVRGGSEATVTFVSVVVTAADTDESVTVVSASVVFGGVVDVVGGVVDVVGGVVDVVGGVVDVVGGVVDVSI